MMTKYERTIKRLLGPLGVKTVMRSQQRKWKLMRSAKNTQPADTVAGAVYALGCETCPKVYIGETARTTAKRIKENKSHSRNGHP